MDKANGSGGVSLLGLLGVLFIGLKLTGYIDWSWWLVLLPVLLPLYIIVGGALAVGLWFILWAASCIATDRVYRVTKKRARS